MNAEPGGDRAVARHALRAARRDDTPPPLRERLCGWLVVEPVARTGRRRRHVHGDAIAGGTPHDAFVSEMRRWGVVISSSGAARPSRPSSRDARFRERGATDWAVPGCRHGSGGRHRHRHRSRMPDRITRMSCSPASRAGDPVIVRTSFHPAWTARRGAAPLARATGSCRSSAPARAARSRSLSAHRCCPLAFTVLIVAGFWIRRRYPG